MATPKLGASAYKHVFDPENGICPKPDHIVQDVHKVVHALKEIYKAKGVFVPGLTGGRVPGKRHTSTKEKTSNNHGGKRKRLEYSVTLDEETMHKDLKSLLNESDDITAFYRRKDDDDEENDGAGADTAQEAHDDGAGADDAE